MILPFEKVIFEFAHYLWFYENPFFLETPAAAAEFTKKFATAKYFIVVIQTFYDGTLLIVSLLDASTIVAITHVVASSTEALFIVLGLNSYKCYNDNFKISISK